MAWFDFFKSKDSLNESISAFKNTEKISAKELSKAYGEGVEDLSALSSGFSNSVTSFNLFNREFINNSYETEMAKLTNYREISTMPEVSEVLEDAANEATQQNDEGDVIALEITDENLEKNENALKNIKDAFQELFHNRININRVIDDWFFSFFIDARLYLENVIDQSNKSDGIIRIKKLPAETMDFSYNPRTGKINWFCQYVSGKGGALPATLEEAEEDKTKYITFYTDQITYIDTGKYGANRKDIIGYLDKVKQPYNQLKLLETSVIIYRIIRAPERLVFKIDVGNMPIDKANKYVEKVKQAMQKKVSYDPRTGATSGQPEILSLLENYFLPVSSARGSSIESVGGNAAGFKEMDDIYFFQKKLYRALKYPQSRVASLQESTQGAPIVFGGISSGDITQDEIKWARFLKKNQDRFTDAFTDLFLLHLNFIGYKGEYDLDRTKLRIVMTPPNNYLDSMWQKERQAKMDNFDKFNQYVEAGYFSKYYLLKNVLKMSDDEIKENIDGFIKDIELGLTKIESTDDLPQGVQDRLGSSPSMFGGSGGSTPTPGMNPETPGSEPNMPLNQEEEGQEELPIPNTPK